MRIASIGGGPAGLYFALLWQQVEPSAAITVFERNRPDDTFGFGVVFSDATLDHLAAADPPTARAIGAALARWDDIHIHSGGRVFRSTGHGFCGLERRTLLAILQGRCRELGVDLRFETAVDGDQLDALRADHDLVLAADGVASAVRARFAAALTPEVTTRPNRFVWLGTSFPFPAFTFLFKASEHGLFRVHAYRYRAEGSTFIVECTAATYAAAGFREDDEAATIAYLERLFAGELHGHRLVPNRSIWRNFPVVRCGRWSHGNLVLLGDAAHTAHFSIGSGTKLAMEDAIALRDALRDAPSVPAALAAYEGARRPAVESLQRAAATSLAWFEHTERYVGMPPIQFAFSLLTRSLRVSHASLRRRDGELVDEVDAWFAGQGGVPARPPRLVPFEIGGLQLANRVVAWASLADAPVAHAGAPGLVLLAPATDRDRATLEPALAGWRATRAKLGVVLRTADLLAARAAIDAGADLLAVEADAEAAAIAELAVAHPGVPLAAIVGGPAVRDLDASAGEVLTRVAALRSAGVVLILAATEHPVAATPRSASIPLADLVRNEANVAVAALGGFTCADDLDSALAAGRTDLCVLPAAELSLADV